ncbi:MAG: RNA polymerase sigma factor [Planctomycetota bacterium]|jgi:RNA polymerase sigma factor (sigma-70 family)
MRNFSQILEQARAGDPDAGSALYEEYVRAAEHEARNGMGPVLRARFDTTDIVQSVFTDMLGELRGFEDRGEASFRHWLRIKIRNKLRTKARRLMARRGGLREQRLGTLMEAGLTGDEDPQSGASARDEGERVSLLLGTLRPEQRAVIGLHIDQQLTWDEVASHLGLPSAGAARLRYVRAIAALRARWKRN